jgi:Tetratricopeptide repeat
MVSRHIRLVHGRAALLGGLLLAQSGCMLPMETPPPPSPPVASPPAKPPGMVINPVPDPRDGGAGSGIPDPVPATVPTAPPVGRAGQALLQESRSQQAAGRYGQAAATVERALRIEPRQPRLWLELAAIRKKEGNSAQADSLARKALSLAPGDPAIASQARPLLRP